MFDKKNVIKPELKSYNYGITDYLRTINVGESFNAPSHLRISIRSCATQIGMRLKIRKIDAMTVYVERVS